MTRHKHPTKQLTVRAPTDYLLTAIENARNNLELTTEIVDSESGSGLYKTPEYARMMEAIKGYTDRVEQERERGY